MTLKNFAIFTLSRGDRRRAMLAFFGQGVSRRVAHFRMSDTLVVARRVP